MKKQIAFCAALVALGFGAVTTAHAQYGPAYPRVYAPGVPPHHVTAIVRSAGMTPLTPPVRRGPNYVVIASDRSGAQVRVVVDGYNGMIVRVRPVAVIRPYGRPYAPVVADSYAPRPRVAIAPRGIKGPPPTVYGVDPYGPSARIDDGLTPPRSVPNARVANVPNANTPHIAAPHALAAHPQRTPLPRPRPAVAANEATGSIPAASDPPAAKPAETEAWPVPAKPAASAPKSGELKMVPVAPLD